MTLLPTTLLPTIYNTTMGTNHTDHTNHTNCSENPPEEWVVNVIPVCILIFTSLGIVFNVFVLMVLCLHKKRSTVAEIYFSNLAIADLVLLAGLPFWAVNISKRFNWPFGAFMCKIVNVCIKLNAYSSIYSLVLVSIDRYLALVHTMTHYRMRKPKYAKLGCLLVWVFSLCCNIPTFIHRKHYYHAECDQNECFMDYPGNSMYVFEGMHCVISFILPICIMSFSTVSIIYALNNRFKPGLNGQRKEYKATILMLVVLLAFLICWTPYHLGAIVDIFVYGGVPPPVLEACMYFFVYLAFFNSFLNPILYVIAGETFRVKVREVFGGVSTNMSTMHTALMRSIRSVNGQG